MLLPNARAHRRAPDLFMHWVLAKTHKRILLKMSQRLTGLLRFSVPSAATAAALSDVPVRQSAVASGAKPHFMGLKKRQKNKPKKNKIKNEVPNQSPSEKAHSMD